MSILKKLMILPPLAVGAGLLVFAISGKTPPATEDVGETRTPVRVLTVEKQRFVPRVGGFGTVRPARTWSAVAEVAGRVQEVHPDFVQGGTVTAGDVLVRIASEDYELAIAQAQSSIESAAAELEQTELSEQTIRKSLAIERASLEIAERELERQRDLALRNTVASATVEAEEGVVLAQRAKVQELENQLTLLPSTIEVLKQSKAVAEAELAVAELNLERTAITAPFAARVADVDIEVSQYAGTGSVMGTLDGIERAEIDAQIVPRQMAGFVRLAFQGLTPSADNRAGQMPPSLKLSAKVKMDFPGDGGVWEAKVGRVSDTVDPATRSIGIIVSVDDPYAGARPGERPPLIKGMFTEVEIYGPAVDDVMLLPRNTIRNGEVMIVDADDRLARMPVDIAYTYDDVAVLRNGLEPGTKVVISDLSPAIDGMLLSPLDDEATAARLTLAATPEDRPE